MKVQVCFTALFLLCALGAKAQSCDVPAGVERSRIVPLVRSVSFVEAAKKLGGGVLPTRRLSGDLVVVFAENTKAQLNYFQVSESAAKCWEEEAALTQYRRNLANEVKTMRTVEIRPGVTMVAAGGNFESSLILAYGVLRKALDTPLDVILVGVPNRDMLLLADPGNTTAALSLMDIVEDSFSKGDNPVSNKLYLVTACMIHAVGEGQDKTNSTCK